MAGEHERILLSCAVGLPTSYGIVEFFTSLGFGSIASFPLIGVKSENRYRTQTTQLAIR